jgi:hypothetical protein
MKTVDVKVSRALFQEVNDKASRLWFFAKNLRVTHTAEQLRSVVKAVHAVDKIANPTDDFVRDFKRALHHCKAGSIDVTSLNDQELSINGVFDIKALREAMIMVEIPALLIGEKHEQEST